MTASNATSAPTLARVSGLAMLVFFCVGSMLGAGIYGLVGRAAGQLGSAVWLGFLVSMVAALLTGLSYASVASRHPRAAGAAYVTQRAYRRPLLSYMVGLAVAASGLTSMATQANVVAANFRSAFGLEELPTSLLAVGFLLILAGILLRGVRESLAFNAVCTTIEAAGLLFVIAVGFGHWGDANLLEFPPMTDDGGAAVSILILQGAVLTFFSFIGFEDALNLSEEVKDPERTMPLGILLAVLIASALYLAVAVTAVSVVPWRELATAPGPLTLVVARAAPWFPAIGFTVITIFAVTNTALVNYFMASRLFYGMSRQGLLFPALSAVHPTRRTPHVAILVLLVIGSGLAMIGDISELAAATVLLLLSVFTVVNIALIIVQRRPGEKPGRFEVPAAVPAFGALICAVLVVVRVTQGNWPAPIIAGGLVAAIVASYFLVGRRGVPISDD